MAKTCELWYDGPASAAYADVESALDALGRVTDSSPQARTLNARIPYAWTSAKIAVSVLPSKRGSRLRIASQGSDIWGTAARKSIAHLIGALDGQGATAAAS